MNETKKWDVVSYAWKSNTTSEALANRIKLYPQNCAACHGENGAGDSVFADDMTEAGASSIVFLIGAMSYTTLQLNLPNQ